MNDEAESHMSKGKVIPERAGRMPSAPTFGDLPWGVADLAALRDVLVTAKMTLRELLDEMRTAAKMVPSDHLTLCEILTRAQVHIVAERDRITVEDEPGFATVFGFSDDGTLTKLSHACPDQTTPRANYVTGFRRGLEIAAEIARSSTFQDGPEGTIEGQIARAILTVKP